jgi:D-serine deaminase-like pyridoxal phosphate-dependent protein
MADAGYGLVLGSDFGRLRVSDVNQEHGFVSGDGPLPVDRLKIGTRLRVLPNHACMTAAAYERYYVIDSAGSDPQRIVAVWDRINGW